MTWLVDVDEQGVCPCMVAKLAWRSHHFRVDRGPGRRIVPWWGHQSMVGSDQTILQNGGIHVAAPHEGQTLAFFRGRMARSQ
jgi:hypothetical protein